MSLLSLAAWGVRKIAVRSGKKMKKQGPAPAIPEAGPVYLRGDGFTVGFASRKTMPDDIHAKKYWMAGFKTGNRVTGVNDPMTVSSMWIGCGDGGILMVSADCIGLSRCEVNRVRGALAGFARQANCISINSSCTHTHAGIDTLGYWGKAKYGPIPGDGKDPAFMEMFLKSIQDACVEAYENRREGKLYMGSARVPEAVSEGRKPTAPRDVLGRIRFVPDDGSAETWLLNFGAHPNTLGGKNSNVSADYPYYLRKKINEARETNVLFTAGAIASINAGGYGSDDRFERTVLQGETLAAAALSIDNDEQLEPGITVLCQPYYSPIDNGVLALMGLLKVINAEKYPCDQGDLGFALQSELTYIRLGKQPILLLPGEMKPELAFGGYAPAETSATGLGAEINPPTLCEIAGDEKLLVFGVTNDMTGYIIAPNDFMLHETEPYLGKHKDRNGANHYHETNSLGYLTAETIADTFGKMMGRV